MYVFELLLLMCDGNVCIYLNFYSSCVMAMYVSIWTTAHVWWQCIYLFGPLWECMCLFELLLLMCDGNVCTCIYLNFSGNACIYLNFYCSCVMGMYVSVWTCTAHVWWECMYLFELLLLMCDGNVCICWNLYCSCAIRMYVSILTCTAQIWRECMSTAYVWWQCMYLFEHLLLVCDGNVCIYLNFYCSCVMGMYVFIWTSTAHMWWECMYLV